PIVLAPRPESFGFAHFELVDDALRAFESADQALCALLELRRAYFADQKHDAIVDNDDDVVLEREFLVLVDVVVSTEVDALVVDISTGAASVVRGACARCDSDYGDRAPAKQCGCQHETDEQNRTTNVHAGNLS